MCYIQQQLWKSATICPLAKVNPPTILQKHIRPISLTPVLAKILESFTCQWVMDAITEDIDPHQYGSIKGSSTVHALVELVHHWQQALDTPGQLLRVLLVDFSKAFDRVDHTILLHKLSSSGAPDFIIRWFTSFLYERQQQTRIGDNLSDWCKVNAGVPQGTLFGPVGFIMHINDLRTCLPTYKYVDDCTLWEACSARSSDSQLQCATDEAVHWSAENHMSVNCDKTKELQVCFGRSKPTLPPITIDDKPIARVSTAKLLGVTFSSDLTWDAHIEDIHTKACQRLYSLRLLWRAGVQSSHIVRIFTSLIRLLLEYACPVWHTGLPGILSEKLEGVQRRALRIAYPDSSYSEAMQLSGLPTLHDRREQLSRGFFQAILSPSHKLHHLLPAHREVSYNLRRQAS